MAKTFDTFIFDLDGTLLDTVPDLTLLTNRILSDLGYPEHTQEEILSYVGSGVRRLMYLALPQDASQDAQDKAMGLWNSHFHEYYNATEPYEEIEPMLVDLLERGCKIGVVSNKLQEGVDLIMDKKLPGYTEVMLGESDEVPRKPDPTGILLALDRLDSSPDRAMYLGDSPGDVKAGKNAGCATGAVLWGYHEKQDFIDAEAVPDVFFSSPLEILRYAI